MAASVEAEVAAGQEASSWRFPDWSNSEQILASVREFGLAIIDASPGTGLMLPQDGEGAPLAGLAELHDAVEARLKEVEELVQGRLDQGVTFPSGRVDCREAVQRDGGRWDLRHGMDRSPFDQIIRAPPWSSVLRDLFGAEPKLVFAGAVVAETSDPEEPGVVGSCEAVQEAHPSPPSRATADALLRSLVLRPNDRVPSLEEWMTLGLWNSGQRSGRFYYEVEFLDNLENADPQVGVLTQAFARGPIGEDGVGDDGSGWAADGVRGFAWHSGPERDVAWPRCWQEGDVVGCALDLEARSLQFSLNGEWIDDATMKLSTLACTSTGDSDSAANNNDSKSSNSNNSNTNNNKSIPNSDEGSEGLCLFPALSMRGNFCLRIEELDWKHRPPTLPADRSLQQWSAWPVRGLFGANSNSDNSNNTSNISNCNNNQSNNNTNNSKSSVLHRPRLRGEPQGWHRDGEPLFPLSMTQGRALPCHCVNVFVPLIDVDERNGATEFLLGTHNLDQGVEVEVKDHVQPRLRAGSAVIMDYRLAHRGGANLSDARRIVLYFTYATPWWVDPSNHRSTESLFEANGK